MKKPFKTQNDQIIDLDLCTAFWVDDIDSEDYFKIFCSTINPEMDWEIAKFKYMHDCKKYIDDIYKIYEYFRGFKI